MARGFTIDKDLREERDGVTDIVDPDTGKVIHMRFAWAVANRPGAVPINGGRRRRIADWQRDAYARYARRNKLGRYTPPRP